MDPYDIVSEAAELTGEITKQAGKGFVGELKKAGQAAVGQILGTGGQTPSPSTEELPEMKKDDKQFSESAQAEVRARIRSIYDEYRARTKKQEMAQEEKMAQEERAEKVAEANQLRRIKDISPAIAKTRAEIKNYGAE